MSLTPEEKKTRQAEHQRRYRESNKDKVSQYRAANKGQIAEYHRRYREENKAKKLEQDRLYRATSNEKIAEYRRRKKRRESFANEDGSSLEAWVRSLRRPSHIFAAVAQLTPEEGQTLAELIHELSGYAMEVCEQIANPPVAEEAPPAQPTPQPDLF